MSRITAKEAEKQIRKQARKQSNTCLGKCMLRIELSKQIRMAEPTKPNGQVQRSIWLQANETKATEEQELKEIISRFSWK